MGSLVVHDTRAIGPSTGLSGWDFVSYAERLMFSRELNPRYGHQLLLLNPDDYRKAGRNLVDGDIFGAFLKKRIATVLFSVRLLALMKKKNPSLTETSCSYQSTATWCNCFWCAEV
ncbi:hypothetical protein ACVXHA_07435 [Escherichia coli]